MALPMRPTVAHDNLSVPTFFWLMVGLICLPLAAVAGIGAARSPLLIAFGVGGLALFALAVLSPPAAMAGLLFAAGFVRVQLSTGTGSPLVASLLAAFVITAAWIVRMLFCRNLSLVRSPVTFPLIAFATVNVLALLWSRATLDPRIFVPATFVRVQVAALMVVILSATTVLIVGGTVRQHRWLVMYLGILFTIGVLHEALIVGHGPDSLVNGRGLIPMWCICLAAALAVINTRLAWWARVTLGFVSAFCFYGLLVHQDWISGWLPASVALLAVFLMRSRVSAVVSLIATVTLIVLLWGVIYGIFTVDKVQQGTLGGDTKRTALWERTLSTIAPSPWLGSGPAGYALAEVQFYPNQALSTHSNYIDVIAQSGLIGLGFFVWFLGAALHMGYRAQRRLRAQGDLLGGSIAVGAVAGLMGIIVAMALGDWVIPFVYNQTIAGFDFTVESWLAIGMLVALDVMSRNPQPEAQ